MHIIKADHLDQLEHLSHLSHLDHLKHPQTWNSLQMALV